VSARGVFRIFLEGFLRVVLDFSRYSYISAVPQQILLNGQLEVAADQIVQRYLEGLQFEHHTRFHTYGNPTFPRFDYIIGLHCVISRNTNIHHNPPPTLPQMLNEYEQTLFSIITY
jgi:hypothetical protein